MEGSTNTSTSNSNMVQKLNCGDWGFFRIGKRHSQIQGKRTIEEIILKTKAEPHSNPSQIQSQRRQIEQEKECCDGEAAVETDIIIEGYASGQVSPVVFSNPTCGAKTKIEMNKEQVMTSSSYDSSSSDEKTIEKKLRGRRGNHFFHKNVKRDSSTTDEEVDNSVIESSSSDFDSDSPIRKRYRSGNRNQSSKSSSSQSIEPRTPPHQGHPTPETKQWICTPNKINPLKLKLSNMNARPVVPIPIDGREEANTTSRKEEIPKIRLRKMSHPRRWPHYTKTLETSAGHRDQVLSEKAFIQPEISSEKSVPSKSETESRNSVALEISQPQPEIETVSPNPFSDTPPTSEIEILSGTKTISPKMSTISQIRTLEQAEQLSPDGMSPEPEISQSTKSVSPNICLEPKELKPTKAVFPRKPRMLKRIELKSIIVSPQHPLPRNARWPRPIYAKFRVPRKPRIGNITKPVRRKVPKKSTQIISANSVPLKIPGKRGRPRLPPKVNPLERIEIDANPICPIVLPQKRPDEPEHETISSTNPNCPCIMCTSSGCRAKRPKRVKFVLEVIEGQMHRESLPLPEPMVPQNDNIEYEGKAKSFPPTLVKENSTNNGTSDSDDSLKGTVKSDSDLRKASIADNDFKGTTASDNHSPGIQQYECTVCKGIITYRNSEFWNPHEVCGNHAAEKAKNNLENATPRAGDDCRWDLKFEPIANSEVGTSALLEKLNLESISGSTGKIRIISGPQIIPPNSTWTLVPPKKALTQYSIKYTC